MSGRAGRGMLTRWFWQKQVARAACLAGCVLALAGCGGDGDARPAGGASAVAAARPAPPPRRPVPLVWPTPNRAYGDGRPISDYVQPTVSGEVTSGLFGSVRSGGRQFHEGLDLFPLERDAKGEALDPVFAALRGVVRHVSDRAGASSYGRYVVLEHPEQSPPVYTLYAHLADIAPGVVPGATLAGGATLGRMGRSAGGYAIPKDRAHLHFEIGLRVADPLRFQAWYDKRGFGSRNEHGAYNGMNLMGMDPLAFFARRSAGGLFALDEIFREVPAALTLRIAHAAEPEFLRRHPSLRVSDAGGAARGGWEIDFTATGVPARWRGLAATETAGWKRDEVRILSTDTASLAANRGRDLVKTVKGRPTPDDDLRTVLEQIFGWKG